MLPCVAFAHAAPWLHVWHGRRMPIRSACRFGTRCRPTTLTRLLVGATKDSVHMAMQLDGPFARRLQRGFTMGVASQCGVFVCRCCNSHPAARPPIPTPLRCLPRHQCHPRPLPCPHRHPLHPRVRDHPQDRNRHSHRRLRPTPPAPLGHRRCLAALAPQPQTVSYK